MDALVSVLVEAETKQDAGYLKKAVGDKAIFRQAILDTDFDTLFASLDVQAHPQSCTVLTHHVVSLCQEKLRKEANIAAFEEPNSSKVSGSPMGEAKAIQTTVNFAAFLRFSSVLLLRGDVKAINGLFPSEFSKICRCTAAVASQADQRENAPLVLQAFKRVIIELGGIFPGCLFPAHIGLLKVALASQSAASTLDVLNNSIYTVEPKQTGLCTKELLLYFYYGGMIYAHVKLYKKATEFFLNCVICPSRVLSSIAIEAYKKYYLVSLLAHGIPPPELPRSVSPVVKRNAPSLVRSYKQFAEAYKRRDFPAMNIIAQENLEEFQGDDNLSLVCHCLLAYKRHQIKALQDTFITVSLEKVAKGVVLSSVDNAEKEIQDMIDRKELAARIDKETKMIAFFDNEEFYNDESALESLRERVAKIEMLSRSIDGVDETVSLSKEYLLTIPKPDVESDPLSDTSGSGKKA